MPRSHNILLESQTVKLSLRITPARLTNPTLVRTTEVLQRSRVTDPCKQSPTDEPRAWYPAACPISDGRPQFVTSFLSLPPSAAQRLIPSIPTTHHTLDVLTSFCPRYTKKIRPRVLTNVAVAETDLPRYNRQNRRANHGAPRNVLGELPHV